MGEELGSDSGGVTAIPIISVRDVRVEEEVGGGWRREGREEHELEAELGFPGSEWNSPAILVMETVEQKQKSMVKRKKAEVAVEAEGRSVTITGFEQLPAL